MLKELRHDHVVEFRGQGETMINDFKDSRQKEIPIGRHFLVMEFVPSNLERYVKKRSNAEKHGLDHVDVWNFGEQILSGLTYLHTRQPPIAHMDLKPDNLLLDENQLPNPRVKLADFGLALAVDQKNKMRSYRGHALWKAPENYHSQFSLDDLPRDALVRSDMYSYGLVLLFLVTGKKPWSPDPIFMSSDASLMSGSSSRQTETSASSVADEDDEDDFPEMPSGNRYEIPSQLPGTLNEIVKASYCEDPKERLTAPDLYETSFRDRKNPFDVEQISAEYFTCGFLKTEIFVADSCVTESTEGSYATKCPLPGYPHSSLRCEVKREITASGAAKPIVNQLEGQLAIYEENFMKHLREFQKKAREKIIDDNPCIGLKLLQLPRAGDDEEQQVVLQFAQTTYCVHRAMRETWKELPMETKHEVVPSKGIVNPTFSNAFGLHVAIVTADKPPMFVFTRRAKRIGLASPDNFTCGAVESCSIKDYETIDPITGEATISLVRTAARGLDEELGVHLEGGDLDAITLSTIYLKHDWHEWGLCGFVDLNDARIRPDRRLTVEQMRTRFTSAGFKDKFEHEKIVAVEFTLSTMVKFVRENFKNFASSAKLVVVKVLQSFFGYAAVEREFSVVSEED
ncbi:uncharacterized protein [Oscarella lobularis]|uniref:uncharacterized protein n=1 Tax=Oscarella lobularis TaxID=121494 RepID=UPI0033134838